METDGSPNVLCLSGGGFRAAVFHLGVIDALRKLELLDRFSIINCVSGGAITGSYLKLYWQSFTGSDLHYRKCVSDFLAILSADLNNRLFLNTLLWHGTAKFIKRTNPETVFVGILDNYLYKGFEFNRFFDWPGPDLNILVTDLDYKCLATITSTGIYPISCAAPPIHEKMKLSRSVAASCAIPPYLPPVCFDNNKRRFADGGLLDNLGVSLSFGNDTEALYVADALGDFDWRKVGFLNPGHDIAMTQIRKLSIEVSRKTRDRVLFHFDINSMPQDSILDPNIRSKLPFIKSRTSKLPVPQVTGLLQHGLEVTMHALGNRQAAEPHFLLDE